MVDQSNPGKPLRTRPRAKITAARRSTRTNAVSGGRPASEGGMATPTMNRKNGKMTSVGVSPCQAAWRRGG
jgi:hypothetical protein